MTRLFNFAIIFLLGTIFYVQWNVNTPKQAATEHHVSAVNAPSEDTSVIQAALKTALAEPEMISSKIVVKSSKTGVATDTPQTAALSKSQINAISARFTAQRLVNSTVIVAADPAVVVAATEPTPSSTPDYFFVDGAVVNARAKPTTASAVLAKLKRGTQVEATGTSKGSWSQVIVTKTGQSVWMHSDFLSAAS